MRIGLERRHVEHEREFAVRPRLVFDFYVPRFNLLIECDGDYWHSKPKVKTRDARKTAQARKLGYRVERLTESFINSDLLDSHLDSLLRQQSLL